MADENQVDGTVTPVSPGEVQGSETGSGQETTQQQTQNVQAQPAIPGWVGARMGEIARQRREAEERAQRAEQRIAQLEALVPPEQRAQETGQTAGQPASQRAIEEMAQRMADERFAQHRFQDLTQRIETRGNQTFRDFGAKMGNFQMVGGITRPLLDTVGHFENAHQLLYLLGSDLDLAAQVMQLDRTAMAIRLAQLSGEAEQRLARSSANNGALPAPIEPVNTRSSGGGKDPYQMNEEEWMAWREEHAPRYN